MKIFTRLYLVFFFLFAFDCSENLSPLGQNELIRVCTEFADGTHRGMYDPETNSSGFPDEEYDATTAMVINWHRLPETDSSMNARLRYRMIHPSESQWITAEGESMEFWYRDERVNRVVITNLNPGSVYEFKVREDGERFRFRTMPSKLEERPLKMEKISYEPTSWTLPDNLSDEYIDNFFSINSLKDIDTGEIVGWEYDGHFISYIPMGMIAIGHGGWAAGRREPGGRGGGNAGL